MQLALGLRTYDLTGRALVVGELAVSPAGDEPLRLAEAMVGAGADVLEVGVAVAAGPGPGGEVAATEEADVVAAAVEALHRRLDVALSCATTRGSVARVAYAAGAVMGNDASGFSDPGFLPAAVAAGASVVAGHPDPDAEPGVTEVEAFLAELAQRAEKAGLSPKQVVVDAGLDRCRAPERARQLLRASPSLAGLGYALSLSTPSLLVEALPEEAHDRRRGAAVGAVAAGFLGGARLLRTSDVRTARRVSDVLSAVLAA